MGSLVASGLGVAYVGYVGAAYSFTSALATVMWGRLAQRRSFGRRWAFACAIGCQATFLAVSTWWSHVYIDAPADAAADAAAVAAAGGADAAGIAAAAAAARLQATGGGGPSKALAGPVLVLLAILYAVGACRKRCDARALYPLDSHLSSP